MPFTSEVGFPCRQLQRSLDCSWTSRVEWWDQSRSLVDHFNTMFGKGFHHVDAIALHLVDIEVLVERYDRPRDERLLASSEELAFSSQNSVPRLCTYP